MTSSMTVYADETDPDRRLAWYDPDASDGSLRDFTGGWVLSAEVVDRITNTVVLNKTTGVTGGDGTAASNVIISWTAAELAQLDDRVGRWLRVVATKGSERAVFALNDAGALPMLFVIPAPT